MLYLLGGDLKDGKAAELQDWVEENEETLAETAPPGWTLQGHYFTVFGFGPVDAAVEWQFDEYADLDAAREHDDETHLQLLNEVQDFFVEGTDFAWLLREAGDTRVLEPE